MKAANILIFLSSLLVFVYIAATGSTFDCVLPGFYGLGLHFRLDGFRAIYLLVTAFLWMMTTIFSEEYFDNSANLGRYYLFLMLTLAASIGVFLSASLYTTFIFFEIMSFTSYILVIHDERPASLKAGETYLAVAVIGGLVLLMGIFLLYTKLGTLEIDGLAEACALVEDKEELYLIGGLLCFGFGAKAGVFPLHIWLPKAHPVAPAPASALLSGILTKTGVFGLIIIAVNLFPGDAVWGVAMMLPALATMLLGGVLALFSIDLKRTLACSSVSQIGFMLSGIAMQCLLGSHNSLAVWGTTMHMVNHSLLKLVLFLTAGVVYMNQHKLDLNEIRGFGRGKPLLAFVFLMGGLGISGFPFWNGFISKTLLHESIYEGILMYERVGAISAFLQFSEVVFIFSGGLTTMYMLKLFVALFLEKPEKESEKHNKKYIGYTSAAVLVVSAVLLPILGLFPALLESVARLGQGFMNGHEPEHSIHYFDWVNLKSSTYYILLEVVLYLLVVRGLLMKKEPSGKKRYVDRWPAWLDMEQLVYRPLLNGLAFAATGVFRVADAFTDVFVKLALSVAALVSRAADVFTDIFIKLALSAVALAGRAADVFTDKAVPLMIAVTTFAARIIYAFIDTAVRLLHKTILRPFGPSRFPGRFLSRYYWLFYSRTEKKQQGYALTDSFSFSLLLFGLGLGVILVYIFVMAVMT